MVIFSIDDVTNFQIVVAKNYDTVTKDEIHWIPIRKRDCWKIFEKGKIKWHN